MNDIWTTKGYTNKDKADEIAKKYNLDAIMVRKALGEGEVFSDNMLVYYDDEYYVRQLDGWDDVSDLIEYLLKDEIDSINDITCIIIDGVKYEASINIKKCDVRTPYDIVNEKAFAIAKAKARAVVIAETYRLDLSKVKESLKYGEVFSDNMIVYIDFNGNYGTCQTNDINAPDKILWLLTKNICKIENIVCVIVNGVRRENLRIKYVHGRRYII